MKHPVLLYDGLCGFCDRTVQFILARDPGGVMRFAPLQGEFAKDVVGRHPSLQGVDSLLWVEAGAVSKSLPPLARSDAIFAIADYLGWPWKAAGVLKIFPPLLRDGAYDLFARHRYQLFGRYDACPLPSIETRARFID